MLQVMTRAEPTVEPDIEGLFDAARTGDQRAFEAFYRATVGRVYGLCLRLAGTRWLAEECVQQTYVQAWRNLSRFRGDSTVSTWLYRIAVNEVRGQYRKEQRHDHLPHSEVPEAPRPATHSSIDLEQAIARLPERARAVFVLVGIYGHTHDETAAMLDMAVGTSKAHYHHARRQLRGHLGDDPSGERK